MNIYPGAGDLGRYEIRLTRSAAGDLDAIPARGRIIDDIKGLGGNPLPGGDGVKKLKVFSPPLYRMRSGAYRVIYRIEGRVVTVLRVIDRKELERVVRKLK